MGKGMLTIVKGTTIAEYVNREHVATLNGALGIPRLWPVRLHRCYWACCGAR